MEADGWKMYCFILEKPFAHFHDCWERVRLFGRDWVSIEPPNWLYRRVARQREDTLIMVSGKRQADLERPCQQASVDQPVETEIGEG